MAQVVKTLGQQAPAAATPTDLYTVPASTATVCNSYIVCNRGDTDATFRFSVSLGGGATADKDYYHYDKRIAAHDTYYGGSFSLSTTDVVRVYASTANLSFNLSGLEMS